MAKYLVMARYSAEGAAGTTKEGLTSRKAMITKVSDGMGYRVVDFWGVASGDWHIAYLLDGDGGASEVAQLAASLLIGTAAGSSDALRVFPLVDTEAVDEQFETAMPDYRPPGG